MLGRGIPKPKANKVPPVKPSPSPNETRNLEATAPGERSKRPDGGLGRGGVSPGRGARVLTRVRVSVDSQGRGRGGCAHLGGACGGPKTGTQGQRWAEESGVLGADPAPPNRQVRGGPHCLGCALWREGGEAATWGKKRGAGPQVLSWCAHKRSCPSPTASPRTAAGPCGVLSHALARIFCFVVSFRSINKCVIVNVKTHQSNNNGTKSKDYPSLLVTAE